MKHFWKMNSLYWSPHCSRMTIQTFWLWAMMFHLFSTLEKYFKVCAFNRYMYLYLQHTYCYTKILKNQNFGKISQNLQFWKIPLWERYRKFITVEELHYFSKTIIKIPEFFVVWGQIAILMVRQHQNHVFLLDFH